VSIRSNFSLDYWRVYRALTGLWLDLHFRTESNPENRIPIDPWLSESVTSEEILSDDDHWEAIHNNFNNWGAERNSDFGLPETDMSLCFTSLQPLEAPEFDASVYL